MAPLSLPDRVTRYVARQLHQTQSAADVFEAGRTSKVSLISWPLRRQSPKRLRQPSSDDIGGRTRRGRRLFIGHLQYRRRAPRHLDMGAIAAHRRRRWACAVSDVLLASTAVPGHSRGVDRRRSKWQALCGTARRRRHRRSVFSSRQDVAATTSDFRLPATHFMSSSTPGSNETSRSSTVFCRDPDTGGQRCGEDRYAIDGRHRLHTRQTQWRRIQRCPQSPQASTRRARSFDPGYMGRCSDRLRTGRSRRPLRNQPPPYPSAPQPQNPVHHPQSSQNEKSGVN